jgi:hypothetical protein
VLPQIEPREVEINEMRETIRAMDAELERYHKSNAGLDLTIQVWKYLALRIDSLPHPMGACMHGLLATA